ncbi:dTDP-4-dehydrorhamnose reductase [Sphingomonas hankyongi]|uniref:dTDP-4-dehydrorhamnose reductase n=1 Tax=Sphingomonas hankyongi TaxID=2908209 RepID=A0ABT0S3G6_9SPHN|nr:dTDP-4-dehydrorhamnose reductase [Sphingomonas hankyongi]MCL6730146.1 dTDP-4-dehydrorhamnose reductase [Sphingomonas hankyongi]
MKILVTGTDGQVARSLRERGAQFPDCEINFVGRPELDLARPGSAAAAIERLRPDLVVNAAAYTAVDLAETEPEAAFRINGDAAGEVARAAHEVGAAIIQLSTDYVFDGTATAPYREDDKTAPINVYGRSKVAGEEQVRSANPEHLIIRTSWVHSPFGRNFVKTMLRLAEDRDEVRIVADQVGCPTNALDIAEGILTAATSGKGSGGTYHFAAGGQCSWAEFAAEIFAVSSGLGGPTADVTPISTAGFPTAAPRPRYSVLDSSRFQQEFGFVIPRWQESVAEVVRRLVSE